MLSFKEFLVEDKSKSLNGIQISNIVDFYHKTFPKWNVIVLPGEGDQSAKRRDVINTYLYEH